VVRLAGLTRWPASAGGCVVRLGIGSVAAVWTEAVALQPALDPPRLVVGRAGVSQRLALPREIVELATLHRLADAALDDTLEQ
jgi:hypothetical protein